MTIPRPEYPRPQCMRPTWLCLNGEWQFEIDPGDSGLERGLLQHDLSDRILVPFCPESPLSGIGNTDFLTVVWYRRTVTIPSDWTGQRILLHFQSVDHDATVWVNGQELGRHRGGFTPFSVELPREVIGHEATIVVRARDYNRIPQARGKQAQTYGNVECVFDLGEADTLLNEAAKRSLFFAINFNHRYARPVQMASQAIADGRLGELSFVTWRFGGEGSSNHPHANLIETQCHGFDMLEFLCGPIESLAAQMTNKSGGGYRTLVLALRFANGAVGSLVGSYETSYAYPGTHLVEVNGDKGRIVIEDTVRRYTFQSVGNETGEVWQAGYFNDRDREFRRTFDKHLEEVLQAYKQGQKPPVPAEAGRRALELAHAAIRSFETGQRVSTR